ncbi:hypothetical protein M2140_002071 [Clostridiales Family XIII bacterium PM5-7]
MYVQLEEILKNEMFSHVEIVAGEKGLDRKVKRISVFDCPCDENLIERNILIEGDAFITSLEQFKYEVENINEYIDTLIKTESAGLFIITDDMKHVLTEEILQKCNDANYPLIIILDDIPYAAIIDTVNKYIAIDNLNSLIMLKLDKIMYGNISNSEKMEVLYSINPNIERFIHVIAVDGEFNSDIAQMEFYTHYLKQKADIYARGNHRLYFVLSHDDKKSLKHHSDATSIRLSEFLDNPVIGYSRICNRKDIGNALEEAKRALDTAKTMAMTSQTYNPMSVLQLLLLVRDTQEAHDYYKAYVEIVKANVSEESLSEILLTIETYVALSGNYTEVAKALNQHENTIRYRVNKVKNALGMEKDNVKFHEAIAVAAKLRTLINEEL